MIWNTDLQLTASTNRSSITDNSTNTKSNTSMTNSNSFKQQQWNLLKCGNNQSTSIASTNPSKNNRTKNGTPSGPKRDVLIKTIWICQNPFLNCNISFKMDTEWKSHFVITYIYFGLNSVLPLLILAESCDLELVDRIRYWDCNMCRTKFLLFQFLKSHLCWRRAKRPFWWEDSIWVHPALTLIAKTWWNEPQNDSLI